jgi:hypothetical protein
MLVLFRTFSLASSLVAAADAAAVRMAVTAFASLILSSFPAP